MNSRRNSKGTNPDRSSTGQDEHMPFTGGSGAGVSVKPVGFLICGDGRCVFCLLTPGRLRQAAEAA